MYYARRKNDPEGLPKIQLFYIFLHIFFSIKTLLVAPSLNRNLNVFFIILRMLTIFMDNQTHVSVCFGKILGPSSSRKKLSGWHRRQSSSPRVAAIEKATTKDTCTARHVTPVHGKLSPASRQSRGCQRDGSSLESLLVGWKNASRTSSWRIEGLVRPNKSSAGNNPLFASTTTANFFGTICAISDFPNNLMCK